MADGTWESETTDFDRQIEALLEVAWQGASPTAGDLARVEALVRARVVTRNASGTAGAGSSGAGGSIGSAGLGAPGGAPGARAGGARSRRTWPRLLPQAATAAERARLLGWGSLIAGIAFLIGVGYGRSEGEELVGVLGQGGFMSDDELLTTLGEVRFHRL